MYGHILYLPVFLILLGVSTAYGKFRYDYVYNKEAEGWLKVHRVPANFRDAFLRCDFEGAVLASPSTEALRKALIAAIQVEGCGIYTGIHSTITHGDYNTIEGIPLGRLPITWAKNEPDNYQDQEDCLIILSSGTLADVRCNETYPFVCYKKKTKNLAITECGTSDIDYKLDKRTGSCYKFHPVGLSWKLGQMACASEGGHLAIINSPQEALVLKELFAKNPPTTITASAIDVAAVGFMDWGIDGIWYTIHGQKLEESGYSNWLKGQPDNKTRNGIGSHCGVMFRNGLLDDFWCDRYSLPYICEKTPESLSADDERR